MKTQLLKTRKQVRNGQSLIYKPEGEANMTMDAKAETQKSARSQHLTESQKA